MADAALEGNIARIVRRSDFDIDIEDTDGVEHPYTRIGQGPSRMATAKELARDALGFTHPNLHRRVDPKDPPIADDERNQELLPRSYDLTIMNVYSYRTTHINTHDEESTYSEVP